MKFACESCNAQYMIADEKVGPSGVLVRCKRCGNRIAVKRPVTEVEPAAEKTVVVPMHAGAEAPQPGLASSETPTPFAAAAGASDFDDDIGRAFDSMVMGDEPRPEKVSLAPDATDAGEPAAAAGSVRIDLDHQPTRVVNLGDVAGQVREEPAPEPPRNVVAKPSAADVEWFVAINDEQVGPLTLQGVKVRWTRGELSADSLAWRVGLPDWNPISSIAELVGELAPLPRPEAERAGAVAMGAETPASAVLPPQSAAAEWKPSAASALEALVQGELAALEKSPSSASKPLDFKTGSAGPVSTLEMPAVPAAVLAAQAAGPASSSMAASAANAANAAAPMPAPASPAGAGRSPYGLPMAPNERQITKSRTGAYVAIGIGGGLAVGALVVAAVIMMTRQPQVIVAAPPVAAPPVAAKAETPPPAPEAKPPVAAEAKPAETAPAANPGEPAAAKPGEAAPEKVAEKPAAKAPEAAQQHAAAVEEKPAPVAERPAAQEEPVRSTREHRGTRHSRESAREERAAAANNEPPPAPSGKSRNKVDEQFDQIFGNGGGGNEAAPAAKQDAKGKTVYVPPPVGNSSLPDKLGQSDVLAVVLEHKAQIKACVDQEKAANAEASGTLVMRWTIRPNGTPMAIGPKDNQFPKAAACLTSQIKTWKWPAYSGAQMPPIDFPFKF